VIIKLAIVVLALAIIGAFVPNAGPTQPATTVWTGGDPHTVPTGGEYGIPAGPPNPGFQSGHCGYAPLDDTTKFTVKVAGGPVPPKCEGQK
jgi:hypothetical protein